MNTLNSTVLDIIKSYPTTGVHKYHWVNGFDGVTTDLIYKNVVIAKCETAKRTYCCGLTFEVYFKAAMQVGIDLGSVAEVKQLKREWFVATPDLTGAVNGLVKRNLGQQIRVTAQPGDFIQFWRKKEGVTAKVAGKYTSGHSAIFIKEVPNGIQYWSTQPSTNGIGYREESFIGNNPIIDLFIVRALK